jgi:RNA polymerase sigma factor (sigma-70 family)
MSLPPFQQLLDHHGDDVLRYLRAAVGSQDAEDAWQETMLAALRAYPGLRDDGNLRGWMFTIAHRKALDTHRARSRRAIPTAEPPEVVVPERAGPEPMLWEAVRRLPQKQRAAVTLRFAADLDYRAIAEMIDCTEPAARQNVRAGLAAVRKEWIHEPVTS